MSVYQSKTGRWYFKFQIRGKEYNRAVAEATSKRDAEKAEVRFKSDLLQGKYDLADHKGEMRFSKLIEIYIEYTKTNNITYKQNVSKAMSFLDFFKDRQLKEITPIFIEKYRSTRKKETKKNGNLVKDATINRDLQLLRKIFNIALDNKWIDENPCSSKKIKPFREENAKERFLSVEEENRLLKASDSHFKYMKPILICALHTGMRKSEILNLKWECVDLKGKYITLLRTKSGKKRKIPISSTLFQELSFLHRSKISEYVFSNPETKNSYYDVKRAFYILCKEADITNFVFHDLRHTAATRMVAAGIDLAVVQEVLGHSEVSTTMRYAHPVPEQKRRAIEALNNYAESKNINLVQLK